MTLSERTGLLEKLGQYLLAGSEEWNETKQKAYYANGWFTPGFIQIAADNIAQRFLQKDILQKWAADYKLPAENPQPKKVGIVMAGNIPMAGFHDLLAVFISGNHALIKLSSKDEILIKHLVDKLTEWNPAVKNEIEFSGLLKGCDAYIATGSNNSSRYFDYYFEKYPHIIRRNRTSVAILTGQETKEELALLADDIFLFFGLGCRNVTKLYVPENYGFEPLLEALNKYSYLFDHHKYKNNYDYNLAIHLLNNTYYMTNGAVLLIEEKQLFSPISQVNYEIYKSTDEVVKFLQTNEALQCIVGKNFIPFGQAQSPEITDYADGEDTLRFLTSLQQTQPSL